MPVRRSCLAALLLAAAAPSAAPAADTAGPVDIGGGRGMYVECRGEGAPAVVIVAGAKASAADWIEAAPGKPNVFEAVAGFTRVCAYDRPGTPFGEAPSRSDPTPQPRSAADSAADLRALIAAAGIPTPVVLAAHSYGGVIARLYARTRPGDVAGMVLVDALSEGLRDAETPEEWAVQLTLLSGDLTETLKLYPEIEQLDADGDFDAIHAAPPMRPMPLVVLSADHPWGPLLAGFIADGLMPPGTPPDAGYVTDRAAKQSQAMLAASAPGARHVTDTDSGHEIHKDQPQLVIDSIRDVVDAVRAGRTRMQP
jgi:pimeloyl-ACP methyl ester carboxylesterase